MKTVMSVFLTLLITLIFAPGCEDALDVNFNADFVADLNADVINPGRKSAATVFTFTASDVIDPKSDEDVKKYAEQIKDLKITKVTAEITSITKPVTLVSGKLKVSASGFTTTEWNFTNVALSLGTKLSIGNETGQITNVQSMLKSLKLVTVELSGETDQAPVKFTLKVTYETEITANPL
jgi:hypothetical protein